VSLLGTIRNFTTLGKSQDRYPHLKTEGQENVLPKIISLRKAHEVGSEIRRKPRVKANGADAEAITLELVMRFEEDIEGREPDDKHKQLGISYDILSRSKNGDDRYIEVKHLRGDLGTCELTLIFLTFPPKTVPVAIGIPA
jgi:hypothetical protein